MCVYDAPELLAEAVGGHERDLGGMPFHRPALPYQPHAEIRDSRCMGQGPYGLTFDRNAMLVDFTVESLTQDDLVLDIVEWRGILFLARVEPELDSIKEMKPGEVDYGRRLRLQIRAEKDGGGEDALESRNHAAIMGAVFGQMKEVEDLRSRPKPHYAGLLSHRKGSDPDGDQAVLPEGEAEARMGGNLQKEPAVPSSMNQLVGRRPPQGDTAEDEGSGAKTQVLPAELALLADEMDRFELLEAAASDSD